MYVEYLAWAGAGVRRPERIGRDAMRKDDCVRNAFRDEAGSCEKLGENFDDLRSVYIFGGKEFWVRGWLEDTFRLDAMARNLLRSWVLAALYDMLFCLKSAILNAD